MRFSTSTAAVAMLAFTQGALGLSGEATFYGGNLNGGMCSFTTYTLPAGIYGTALSDSNWDDAAHCGSCIEVTGPSGSNITAMIVDQCPGCGTNHLDLFPDAFDVLSDPSVGIIQTTWNYVDCPITSPLQVNNKDGVSPYWFSMQVVNADKEVSTLEVSTDSGSTWQSTQRQTYNFFEQSSGFGTSSVSVKVTSIDGDEVILDNVAVSSGNLVTADSNFGGASSESDTKVITTATTAKTSASTTAPTSSTAPGAVFVESESSSVSTSSHAATAATYETPASVKPTTEASLVLPSPSATVDVSQVYAPPPTPTASSLASSIATTTSISFEATSSFSPASSGSSSSPTFPSSVSSATAVVQPITASSSTASTTTVYSCPSSSLSSSTSSVITSAPSSGFASSTILVSYTPKAPTTAATSPIAFATGAASFKGASGPALSLAIAGAMAFLV